jgi:glycosyltransferase involved in cell wall biosynthesis
MPTRSLEGFGLTTVESMACGTPVAATPVGANPEVVSSLDPDLVLPGAEPAEIREGLLRLLADRAKLIELRRRSRDLVESCYTWDRMASALLECVK